MTMLVDEFIRVISVLSILVMLFPVVGFFDRLLQLTPRERSLFLRYPLQPVAAALKLIGKRGDLPGNTDSLLHRFAPVGGLFLQALTFCLLPIGGLAPRGEIPVGYLFILPLLSMLSVPIAGYASGNPLAMSDGFRQFILRTTGWLVVTIAAVGVCLAVAASNVADLVGAQSWTEQTFLPTLGIVLHPVGFLCAVLGLALIYEKGRGRRHNLIDSHTIAASGPTELAHRIFATWEQLIGASVTTVVFLGGSVSFFDFSAGGVFDFIGKVLTVSALVTALRWVLPPLRHDQVLRLLWGILIPLTIFSMWLPLRIVAMLLSS